MYLKPATLPSFSPEEIPAPKLGPNGRKLVSDEQRQFMVKLYTEHGLSTWKIGKIMGYLNVCVINNLKKAGLQLRTRCDAAKMLDVRRDYFQEIDTHNKAYLLGLFYADGNVHKDTFTIALKEPDKYMIEAIAKEFGMSGKIGCRPRRG